MTGPSVVDFAAAKRRRHPARNDAILADFALAQCEDALFWRDWRRFEYWFRVHRGMRPRLADVGCEIALRASARQHEEKSAEKANSHPRRGRPVKGGEIVMRYGKIGLAFLFAIFATPVPAQTPSHSSSGEATVVAAATLPDVTAAPLYVELIGGRVAADEVTDTWMANGVFYQFAGGTEISVDGKTKILATGEGIFIPRGSRVGLKSVGAEPSVYLQFLLSPVANSDRPGMAAADGKEMFRSSMPVQGLAEGVYDVNLKAVSLPHQAPADIPHLRSGAALHFVLSGFGAETANGATVMKGPGSVSYEPAGFVYQWSNPGNVPLNYLVFNLNPISKDAVMAAAAPGDPQR